MEWVETTGRTVAEAKDAALDELGVDEVDAEFEVLSEPQHGLFGRLRAEARVRARVRPTAPRAKDDRRNRDRKRRSEGRNAQSGPDAAPSPTGPSTGTAARSGGAPQPGRGPQPGGATGRAPQPGGAPGRRGGASEPAELAEAADVTGAGAAVDGEPASGTFAGAGGADEDNEGPASPTGTRRRRRRGGHRPGEAPSGEQRARAEQPGYSGPGSTGNDADGDDDDNRGRGSDVEVDMDQQAEVAVSFLTELAAVFGAEATTLVVRPDEDTAEIRLSGPDLGILIGPKGQTLTAIQNLTRTVVFNETGGNNGHINVDVSGYRQKRTEALVRFAQQAADHVKTSGQRTALEPMSSIDRKIVHDTIAEIDGVSTVSEGEEPRRRVVVLPA